MIDAIICFKVLFEVLFQYYLICEYIPVVLSAIIILLTVIFVLLLHLLTEKICLWETDQANSSSLPANKFIDFVNQQSWATRQPS